MSEYNAATCVTAGELRAMGISVDAAVPDVGWVPRTAVEYGAPDVAVDPNDRRCVITTIPVTFHAPWRWVEGKIDFVV